MYGENFTRVEKEPWTVWLTRECEQNQILAAVDLLCTDLASGGERHQGTPGIWQIHGGGRSTIYGAEVSGMRCCVKVFTDKRLQSRIRTFLGWSKGRRAFKNGLSAHEQNVPVPQVYAYAERKPFGPTLVVMELLENANQMNLLIEERLAQGIELATDPFFLRLVESFARFTKGLHAKGVCHSDFSPRNVLVIEENDGLGMQLIDLEDLEFSNQAQSFRDNIDHFNEKMTRYVNGAALNMFLHKFQEFYGKD